MGKYLALITLVAVASAAWGQQDSDDNPWYAGANVGFSEPDESDLDMATGFKIYGGYHFNDWLDAEVGYTDLGEMDNDADLDVMGADISAIGRFSIGTKMDIFGRLGIYAWDASGDDLSFGDDTGIDPVLGFGTHYAVSEQFGVRAEYEHFYDVDDVDIDFYSIGAVVDF